MDAIALLNEWLRYSKYDPDQKRFNLLSSEYTLHRCNERIEKLTEYDPTGAIAVMYAKTAFEKTLRDKRISVFDVVSAPAVIEEEVAMWKLFTSEDVEAVEQNIIDSFNKLVSQVVEKKMLGNRDLIAEKNALFDSVSAVAEELDGCNVDLFLQGGNIAQIGTFSTHIHVFERLAECLTSIEDAKDGIYLCYVNNGGTADGYFGFYIKSNGSILSVNERVNEAYPGQHKNSRNGRWSESKKFELFPYDYIFSFSEYDYKGYANKHMIDNEKLAFFNLSPGAYMPLIFAMIMLNNKYAGADVSSMSVKYLDSMLSVNIELPTPGTTALVVPSGSAIAALNRGLTISMTAEAVRSGEYAERLSDRSRHYLERGEFCAGENIFADMYGDGFELDSSKLLEANTHLKRLTSSELEKTKETPNSEFVGTEGRMEIIAYKNARHELAEYVRDRMYEEYQRFGGRTAVERWWNDTLRSSRARILDLCVEKYNAVQEGTEKNVDSANWRNGSDSKLRYIDFQTDCKGEPQTGFGMSPQTYPLNESKDPRRRYGKKLCCITENMASIFFMFRFNDWLEIGQIVGEENIPKIVKGWQRGRRCCGNPLLNATDEMSEVGTPFESDEARYNKRYWTRSKWSDYYFDQREYGREPPDGCEERSPSFGFDFAVGFSKRGFADVLKGKR